MGSDYADEEVTGSADVLPTDDVELCAQISVDGVVSTHVLPMAGVIEVGRAAGCDVVIDHPSVSRRHARLSLAPLQITDENSRNGTRLRGTSLEPGVAAPLAIGEAVQLGQITMLIHYKTLVAEGPTGSALRWSSESLVRQIEIECARSARSGSPFAYARLHVDAGELAYEQLRATLRTTDIVADSRRRFELLLPDTSSAQAAGATARLLDLAAACRADVRIAVARYPYDGTTAEALIARVWEQLDRQPGTGAAMDATRALIAQVAGADVSVLISGETGVGKELCAEMIHRQSPRALRPFVKLNCSTITESLIESELFGHERGAFTGATASTPGLLESGQGGTVFLDEIGELPLHAQAKLLRVLEERIVRRVGSSTGRTLDIRFVCATNRYLPDEVEAGRFRRDLYYRINGVTIEIPPLRERTAEIAALARAFAARPRGSTPPAPLSDDVIEALARHPWPGNIRELRNTVERALVLAGGGRVTSEHLRLDPEPPRRSSVPTLPIERISSSEITGEGSLATSVAEVERRRILEALERCGGNQTRAARMLGISRNTLLTRLDVYGLPRPRKS